jgi:aryl-alcohol dehydrogenase-like predicted oxidoreductase
VDLFQLHNAGAEVVRSLPELAEFLEQLREEGKVRAFGFSTPTPEDALALLDFPGVATFQVNCNLLDWRAIDCGLLDKAATRGVGVVIRTPLAFGFLSGQLSADVSFDASDHRSRWPRERIAGWVAAADELFGELGSSSGSQRVEAAMRFCLSLPAVATVIPGMLTPQEVRANAAASDHGVLPPDVIAHIGGIYRRHEARLRA